MKSSVETIPITIIRHALLVMLVGMLGGFGWAFALTGQISLSPIPMVLYDGFIGEPARWRAVHLGCLLNGIMGIVFALTLKLFALSSHHTQRIKLATIVTLWGNCGFYLLSILAPNRGLSLGDNALGLGNVAGNIAYISAMLAVFSLFYLIITLLTAPLNKTTRSN